MMASLVIRLDDGLFRFVGDTGGLDLDEGGGGGGGKENNTVNRHQRGRQVREAPYMQWKLWKRSLHSQEQLVQKTSA